MSAQRVLRSLVAIVTVLALAAGALVLCPCGTAVRDAHACCESAGWRAARTSCCDGQSRDHAAVPAPDDSYVASAVFLLTPATVAAPAAPTTAIPASFTLPPVPVLRI